MKDVRVTKYTHTGKLQEATRVLTQPAEIVTEAKSVVQISASSEQIVSSQKLGNDLVIFNGADAAKDKLVIKDFFTNDVKLIVEDTATGDISVAEYTDKGLSFTHVNSLDEAIASNATDESHSSVWVVPLIGLGLAGAAVALSNHKSSDDGADQPLNPQPQPEAQPEAQPEPEPEPQPDPNQKAKDLQELTRLALDEANQSLQSSRAASQQIAELKDQVIKNSDFQQLPDVNSKIAQLNKSLDETLAKVAKANKLAKEAQLAALERTDISKADILGIIKDLRTIDLNPATDDYVKSLKTVTEHGEAASFFDILAEIAKTGWSIIKDMPKFVFPLGELTVQVVVLVFGALGLFIPHGIVGLVKLLTKIPTFVGMLKDLVVDGYEVVKNGIETLVHIIPALTGAIGAFDKILKEGNISPDNFVNNFFKGIGAFLGQYASFLDNRPDLVEKVRGDYPVIGVQQYADYFAFLLAGGSLKSLDAFIAKLIAQYDSNHTIQQWYHETFEPVWSEFSQNITALTQGIAKLVGIPVDLIVSLLTNWLLVANESAAHKLSELIATQIDHLVGGVANILHKVASYLSKGEVYKIAETLEDPSNVAIIKSITDGSYQTDTLKLVKYFGDFLEANKGLDVNKVDKQVVLEKFEAYLDEKGQSNFKDLLAESSNELKLEGFVGQDIKPVVDLPAVAEEHVAPQVHTINPAANEELADVMSQAV